jgi:hypothetical protein
MPLHLLLLTPPAPNHRTTRDAGGSRATAGVQCTATTCGGRGPTLTIFAIGPGQALRPVHPFALEHITGHRARWTAVVGRIRPAEPGNPFRFSSVVYLFLEFIQTSKIHVKLYKHSKLQNKFCLNPCEYIYT